MHSILKVFIDDSLFELQLINCFENGERESIIRIQLLIDGFFRGKFIFQKAFNHSDRNVEYFIPFDCYGGDLLHFINELKKVKNGDLNECTLRSGEYDSYFIKIHYFDKGFGRMVLSAEFNDTYSINYRGSNFGNKLIVFGYEFNQSYLDEIIRVLEEFICFAKTMGVNMTQAPE